MRFSPGISLFDPDSCRAPGGLLLIGGLFFFGAFFCIGDALAQDEPRRERTRNSTRKIRVEPDALSARAGTGVAWEEDVEAALERSRETGKPVFWYVPSVRGTFMDRKPVIDRYMMAGPFSWTSTIQLLNGNFIPVKAVPRRAQARQYELEPYLFVEPGFLILDSEGNELAKTDKITTLHPDWFNHRLAQTLPGRPELWTRPIELDIAYEQLSAGDDVIDVPVPDENTEPNIVMETMWLKGMIEFRAGYHDQAQSTWQTAAEENPEHPLAWKMSCEAQGFGPFVRGFEVHSRVTEAMISDATVEGSAAPTGIYDETAAIARSMGFLLGMQRADGGWVDSDYDFGGTDSLPNVYVAITSLCAMSLIECTKRFPDDEDLQLRLHDAIDRAAAFVTNDANFNRDDTDEILWAFAYRVRFLSRYVNSDAEAADGVVKHPEFADQLQAAVRDLESIQSKQGGWYHEYRNPFVTGTALCALYEAKEAGATVNGAVVKLGGDALGYDRFENGAYPYGSRSLPQADDEEGDADTDERGDDEEPEFRPRDARQISASAGRMPLCDLGLMYWGRVDEDVLAGAIGHSMDLHWNLEGALKYDDHTDNLAYGGFFFWYDMRGRSEAIAFLSPGELKDDFIRRQKEIIMRLPEFDGCFVDSHELGRCYGTAMAILSLSFDQ